MNDIAITAAFDSGNIEVVEIAGTQAQLTIRRDRNSEFFNGFIFACPALPGAILICG